MSLAAAPALRALHLLDLTDLAESCREPAVDELCARSQTPHGAVAAICIWPRFVTQARRRLAGSPVAIATVINFPHGGEDLERAIGDAREALRDGAREIDLVMPWKAFLAGDEKTPREMIEAVADEVGPDRVLKVILETGALAKPEAIARACRLAIRAGANFLKTSTGKTAVSATPEAAEIMLAEIRASGRPVGFKAAGGVRTLADAQAYLALADRIMGPQWASPATFRFGASGLLDALLSEIGGGPAKAEGGY